MLARIAKARQDSDRCGQGATWNNIRRHQSKKRGGAIRPRPSGGARMAKRMQWGALLMALSVSPPSRRGEAARSRSVCRPSRSPPTIRKRRRKSRSATSCSTTPVSRATARSVAAPATPTKRRFTDSPRKTSRGIRGQVGTRNAPTVINCGLFPHAVLGRARVLARGPVAKSSAQSCRNGPHNLRARS